jgi:DNA-directed RNA polymerase subunit M/transcription elongation factor TFIIS
MSIEFCPDCGSPFERTKLSDKTFFTCSRCGLRKEADSELVAKEELTKEVKGEGSVDDKDEFADYEHECKKCGHNKVRIMDMGIFYSDEDNLILLKCGKCGFSERVGKKVS